MAAPCRDFVLQVKLTARCDLKCARCYNIPPNASSRPELGTGEWTRALQGARDYFKCTGTALHVHFIGGEPLLRPDLFELAGIFKGSARANTTLVTNGYALKDEMLPVIKGLFHAATVNMPALDAKRFEDLRGEDCFEKILGNVRGMVARKIPVALAMNVSKQNHGEVGKLVELASILGVRRVSFHRFIGTTRLDDWHLTPELLREVIAHIKASWVEYPGMDIVTRDPVLAVALGLDLKPCVAGAGLLNIEPDGSVTACRYITEVIGDITRQPISEILAGEGARKYSDAARLRSRCSDCTSKARCRGCRALAIHNGDLHGEDPLCHAVLGGGAP